MKEATIILFVIIILAVILGLMYNTILPYLEKDKESKEIPIDGGIFVSKDGGGSWVKITAPLGMEQFMQSDILSITFDVGDENRAYIGTSGGMYIYNKIGDSITAVSAAGGMVQSIAVDPQNKDRIYFASSAGSGGRIMKTTRQLNFYEVYSTSETPANKSDNVLGIWIDPYNPQVVYAGTQSGLFLESKNFGESWSIKKEFEEPFKYLEIYERDTRIMYGIVGGAKIFKTFNSGLTWQDFSSAFPNNKNDPGFSVQNLIIDPHNANTLYAATSKGLFVSRNGGVFFAKVSLLSADENPQVSYVSIDPFKEGVIYAGIGSQVHKTEDGGAHWRVKTLGTQRNISIVKTNPLNPNIVIIGVKSSVNPAAAKAVPRR